MKRNFWTARLKTILIVAVVLAVVVAVILGITSGATFGENVVGTILEMEEDVRTAEQYQRENEQLKTLLGLSEEHEDYSFVSAYIISWDSSDYKSAFTIGKGRNSGLEEGMCAVTENGQVVGLITKVGVNWATITRPFAWLYHEREPGRDGRCQIRDLEPVVRP